MESVHSRHELLRHLGVNQWYSKYILPKAPATPVSLYYVDTLKDNENESSGVDTIGSLVDGSEAESQSLNVVIADLVTNEPEKHEQPSPEIEKTPTAVVAISLSLSMVRFGSLLVCYESNGSQAGDGLHLEQKLLLSILRSIDAHVEVSGVFNNHDSFVWPPFLSSSLFKDQSSYFELSLKRWLCLQDFNGVTQVLYFGASFHQIENIFLEVRSETEADFILLPVDISLSELVGVPVKKKSLWALLSRVGMVGD